VAIALYLDNITIDHTVQADYKVQTKIHTEKNFIQFFGTAVVDVREVLQ
jgi:hypothetical protein